MTTQRSAASGVWVILAARAKYAAGYTWPDEPDVWHDPGLRKRMLFMWRFLAARRAPAAAPAPELMG